MRNFSSAVCATSRSNRSEGRRRDSPGHLCPRPRPMPRAQQPPPPKSISFHSRTTRNSSSASMPSARRHRSALIPPLSSSASAPRLASDDTALRGSCYVVLAAVVAMEATAIHESLRHSMTPGQIRYSRALIASCTWSSPVMPGAFVVPPYRV